MRVADTDFLYALFSESDDFPGRALSEAARAGAILVPGENLSETLSLIQHPLGAAARAAGGWIRGQAGLEIGVTSRKCVEKVWAAFVSGRARLSSPDSVVVAWCEGRGVEPLAFDEALLHALQGRAPGRRQPS